MHKLTNPYTAGDPVGKTSFFVGREDVLREVERVLRHQSQNAITLFGQRRIGKTSILQYLETHLPERGNYQPVYFDLMHKTGVPLGDILRDLARTIALKLNLSDPKLGNTAENTFRKSYLPEALRSLQKNASLVLLLDEFDVLADPKAEQQSKREFFSYLRDLRQLDPQRLQFVFVLGRNIDDLDVVAQGLFKDLPSKRVSLLDQKDAEKLVRLSERNGSLTWSPAAVAEVWKLTSGHPYLTQALCSQIWEDAYDGTDKPSLVQPKDVESAVSGTLERSQNMFVWLWDGLGPAERVVAAALAGVGQKIVDEDRLSHILAESGVRILIGELRDAPQILQKWDILSPVDGGYRFRVELLRYWIAENKPLSRTQEELDRINPVANSLFDAARGYYLGKNLEQAESLLRQALGLNPNHLRAGELLAEILLGKGNLDEAQQVLERLEEIAPEKANRRLKQVYLQRADANTELNEKLKWYEKILKIFPDDPQAKAAHHEIYENLGEQALQSEDFQDALTAYQKIGDTNKVNEILALMRWKEIENGLVEISRLETERAYQDAYHRTQVMAERYPEERNWQSDLERLRAKTLLSQKYEQGLSALKQGDRAQARQLFAEVIALDPEYQDASRYLYMVVTGEDPLEIKKSLALTKEKLNVTLDYIDKERRKNRNKEKTTWVSSIFGQNRRLMKYMPQLAVGHGIKRGLTAAEAAILMEQPLDRVLAIILIFVLKKGAATIISHNPLILQTENLLPDGLHKFEELFLQSITDNDGKLRESALQNMLIVLINSVTEKMRGFSGQETIDYYKSISEKAWDQIQTADTPEVKSQRFNEAMEWTMLSKDFDSHIHHTFTGLVIIPKWLERYAPKDLNLSSVSGSDFVNWIKDIVQLFSSRVLDDLSSFTSSVTRVTNPP